MNRKFKIKIAVDMLMTISLLFLMSFELIGDAAHEWLGMAMFFLFVVHHVLNRKWTGNLRKGKYTMRRVMQTILVVLLLLCMAGSMLSGIILSNYVFKFVRIKGAANLARNVHMLCAYWGFLLMSVHLGMHWNMMIGMAGKAMKKDGDITEDDLIDGEKKAQDLTDKYCKEADTMHAKKEKEILEL